MGQPTLLFIHRSVGQNLLNEGKLYKLVQDLGQPFRLSDYNQNTDVLTTDERQAGRAHWQFPGNDTKPRDFAALFSENRLRGGDPMLRAILGYDIIAIKSCYPNSNIHSDAELEQIKLSYRQIAAFFNHRAGKQLVILTSPPLPWYMTTPANAARARTLSDWLATTNFGRNVFVFNLFDELATPLSQRHAHTLRAAFRRRLPFDAHPNDRASETLAPKVVHCFQSVATQ